MRTISVARPIPTEDVPGECAAMTLTTPPASAATADRTPASTALAWRRWAFVLTPVIGGALITLSLAVDPAAGIDGREMLERYAARTDAQQLHTNLLHWGFGFFAVSALYVGQLVRSRGAWLANLGVAFAFVGLITLPGLVAVDFVTSAVTQVHGVEVTLAAEKQMDQMWGLSVFALPGMIGLIAGPVLAAAALVRSGSARWWAPVAFLLSFVAFEVSQATWWGGVLMTAFLAAYSVALYRASAQTS